MFPFLHIKEMVDIGVGDLGPHSNDLNSDIMENGVGGNDDNFHLTFSPLSSCPNCPRTDYSREREAKRTQMKGQ